VLHVVGSAARAIAEVTHTKNFPRLTGRTSVPGGYGGSCRTAWTALMVRAPSALPTQARFVASCRNSQEGAGRLRPRRPGAASRIARTRRTVDSPRPGQASTCSSIPRRWTCTLWTRCRSIGSRWCSRLIPTGGTRPLAGIPVVYPETIVADHEITVPDLTSKEGWIEFASRRLSILPGARRGSIIDGYGSLGRPRPCWSLDAGTSVRCGNTFRTRLLPRGTSLCPSCTCPRG
jgi:hypothetical protein